MHIYNRSTPRRIIWSVRINWSRELTFSERQISYISQYVPKERGVYCIYAKNRVFSHWDNELGRARWSPVVYIGCGWIRSRLCSHLKHKKNDLLAEFLDNHDLAYRYDRIDNSDPDWDWPRVVEAGLLRIYLERFGSLPPANRREETFPDLDLDGFLVDESDNFSVMRRR